MNEHSESGSRGVFVRVALPVMIITAFVAVSQLFPQASDDESVVIVDQANFAATGMLSSQAEYDLSAVKDEDGSSVSRAWARTFENDGGSCFELIRDRGRLASGRGFRFVVLDRIPMLGEGIEWSRGADSEPPGEALQEGDGSTPTDLTGDGVPEAIVLEWSGGAHCCFTLHVFQFCPRFQFQRLELKHADAGIFFQADDDPALEIRMHDWTFAYWNCSFADSPAPEIVLKHDGSTWKPCAALMRTTAPESPQPEALADNWRRWDQFVTGVSQARVTVPWRPLLELIYAGHAERAWKLLDAAWPGSPQGKEDFRRDLVQQLRTSPAWPALVEMNGAALTR
jgi:hypothetical protein